MERMECRGLWWLPDAPSDRTAGTLRIEEDGSSTLALIGVLRDSEEGLDVGGPRRNIVGVVDRSPFGTLVSLRDCWKQSRSMSFPGFVHEQYYVDRVFFGEHLAGENADRFSSASFRFSGLDVWAARLTGLSPGFEEGSPEDGALWRLKYIVPPQYDVQLGEATLTLRASGRMSYRWREQKIEEKIVFDLEPSRPMTDEEIQTRFLYPIQNFITLGTNRPNALLEFFVGRPSAGAPRPHAPATIRVVGPRIFWDEQKASGATAAQALLTFEDLGDRFPETIRRWLEVHTQYAEVCNIFFGLWYAPPRYLDLKFVELVQVLCLYQGQRGGEPVAHPSPPLTDILAKITQEERDWLTSQLAQNPLTRAERALRALLEEQGAAFDPMIEGKRVEFVQDVLSTFAYLTSRDPGSRHLALSGSDLHWTTEKLAFLMKICFLSELGFSKEERKLLLQRNEEFQFIATQVPTGREPVHEER